MGEWRDFTADYLTESLRRHGLGSNDHCARCRAVLQDPCAAPQDDADPAVSYTDALYQCRRCGEYKLCKSCCLDSHRGPALHAIKVRFTVVYAGQI